MAGPETEIERLKERSVRNERIVEGNQYAIEDLKDKVSEGFERTHKELANVAETVAEMNGKMEAKPQECSLHLRMIDANKTSVAEAHSRIDAVDAKIWPSVLKGISVLIAVAGLVSGIIFGIIQIIKTISQGGG